MATSKNKFAITSAFDGNLRRKWTVTDRRADSLNSEPIQGHCMAICMATLLNLPALLYGTSELLARVLAELGGFIGFSFRKATVAGFMLGMCIYWGMVITAEGADIRPHIKGSGSYRELVIEGIIKPGDFEKFIKMIKSNDGKISTVYLFTPGGDFDEAMKIGRAMRTLELASMSGPSLDSRGRLSCDGEFGTPAPTDPKNCTCASAGFFIHIGGVHRGGTFLTRRGRRAA